MALAKKTYNFWDLEERELDEAPSLDIPHLQTVAWFTPKDGGSYMVFMVNVNKSYRPKDGCPYCGSDDLKREGTASKPRLVHDVIRNNFRVDLVVNPPRMSCKTCKAKFTPEIKGISGSRQMTTRLEEFLRTECFLQPFTILAERSGFSVTTIEDIMDEEIAKYEAKRAKKPLKAPRVLGIDEKHLGSIMRGTLVDVEQGVLLDIMEDNKRDTMRDAIKKLKNWDKNIKVVTTDMNNSYLKWLEDLLPDATIVIDKFHVIQDVEQSITKCKKALIEYRKEEIEKIEDKEERARQYAILRIAMNNGRLFNFSMARLAREEGGEKAKKLATVIDEFPEFRMLHNLHYYVEYLYEQTNREDAEKVWEEWLEFLPPGGPKQYKEWCDLYCFDTKCFEAFRSFSRREFQFFRPYILNYFNSADTRYTNAVTEGLNSLIGDINMDGKGYEFRHLRAKCLYASLIHERVQYGINMKTVQKWKSSSSHMGDMYMMTPDFIDNMFKQSFTTEFMQKIEFTKIKKKILLPLLNIYKDNSWLTPILNADYIEASEMIRGKDLAICDCEEMSVLEYAIGIFQREPELYIPTFMKSHIIY